MTAISQIKEIERQSDKKISEWQSNVALLTVNVHINYLKSKYKRNKKINTLLIEQVKQHINMLEDNIIFPSLWSNGKKAE